MMGAGKSSIGRRLAARARPSVRRRRRRDRDRRRHDHPGDFRQARRALFPRRRGAGDRAPARPAGRRCWRPAAAPSWTPQTRAAIRDKGISVWLKADLDVLMRRTKRRSDRPLVERRSRTLLPLREPIYAQADITVQSRDVPHDTIVDEIIAAPAEAARRRAPRRKAADDRAAAPGRADRRQRRRSASAPTTSSSAAACSPRSARASRRCGPARASRSSPTRRWRSIILPPAEAALKSAGIDSRAHRRAGRRGLQELTRPSSRSAKRSSPRASSAAISSSRSAAASSAISPALPPRSCGAASISCRCRPRCWRRSIPRSAARPASIRAHGKNLVGAFHQPILVIADTALLDTLPPREFRAGYAEVAKYGLLGDAAFFAWLEANWRDVFAGGAGARARHRGELPRQGRRSSRATSARPATARCSISATPSATRSRPAAGFSGRLLHGEAVALGMALAFEFSARARPAAARPTPTARRAHLAAVGLPTRLQRRAGRLPDADALMDLIAQDKKVKRGKLTFILARGIGASFRRARRRPRRGARLPRGEARRDTMT